MTQKYAVLSSAFVRCSGINSFTVLGASALLAGMASLSGAQGFPNVPRTEGEYLAGPLAPEQGRTAIVAWHGERLVTVPEPPGSQPGADVDVRIMDISDLSNVDIIHVPDGTGGFNSHGYYKYGPYLYTGTMCLNDNNEACDGTNNNWRNGLMYDPANTLGRTKFGTSDLVHAAMEGDAGIPMGTYGRAGAQSPWGARHWWSYGDIDGQAWLSVRRSLAEYVHDWTNGGAATGPAVQATWDHLAETGVIGMPFIMGNILIYASDQSGTGVASYDISDPTNPILLDVLKEGNPGGYWPEVYGHYVFFPRRNNEGGVGSQAGYMIVDFSDPTDLRVVANRNTPGSNQYVTFQDEYAFMNNYKIDMRTFDVVLEFDMDSHPLGTPMDASQFALPVGNLVMLGGYGTDGPGISIFAHQADSDTRSPFVVYHVPVADQTNFSTVCPITISIPETLKTETIINGTSLIVQPVGGSPVDTWHAFGQNKLLTITPMQPLQDNTTYEVILTSDIEDAAGNGLEPYTFRFSTGSSVSGGNQPPEIISLSAAPEIPAPNTSITFNWSGNDPENGLLEYRIDFGDGSPRTDWDAATSEMHTYTEPGHYRVTVQVRDDQGTISASSQTITVIAAPSAPNSTASSPIILDPAAGNIISVNPDNDTVTSVDRVSLNVNWEVPVGRHPVSIAQGNDGTLWVVCRDGDALDVLNASDGSNIVTLDLPYGTKPVAVSATPDGSAMLVSSEGTESLLRYSVATRTQTGSLALGPYPRAIAVTEDGSRAFVTRFLSGEYSGSVYDVNLNGSMSLTRTINLERNRTTDSAAGGRGIPNYLSGIRIDPNGEYAWVVGKKDNTTRGTFFSETQELGHDNTVRAMMLLIDISANNEDREYRFDFDNSESPTAMAFSPLGDYLFTTLQGNNAVAVIDVIDFLNPASPGSIHTSWNTGLAPQGLVMDPDTNQLFTKNLMGRSVTSIDTQTFFTSGVVNVPIVSIPTVSQERMSAEVLRGKQVFYNADDPRMSGEGYISCATCHVDGGHDGRTWDFTGRGEGFRNTTDLRGRSGTWHGMVHWSANFDEIQDFENDIRNAFGGEGFLSDEEFASVSNTLGTAKAGLSPDLDALAAYVSSLGTQSLPRSPYRESNGALSTAAQAGLLVFNANNCASCHTPSNDYTDRLQHNVGTINGLSGNRLAVAFTEVDTPTLLGLHESAPYFHDGRAETLEEVFTTAGGMLVQAEDAVLAGGANAQDVNWEPMKEWHNSQFANIPGSGSLTIPNVNSSAGDGFIEIRYSQGYTAPNITIAVNSFSVDAQLPRTPNNPGWRLNEWRTDRVPVTFESGSNNVIISMRNGDDMNIDDVMVVTPDDLQTASAHNITLTPQELSDLTAYLLSLDGSNAALPMLAISRNGEVINSGSDEVELPINESELSVTYTIENTGTGPLNLGYFYVSNANKGPAASGISITDQPAPNLLPGETTTIDVLIPSSAVGTSDDIEGWSDAANINPSWSINVVPGAPTRIVDYHVFY